MTTELNAVETTTLNETTIEEATSVDSAEVAIDIPSTEVPQDETTKVPSDMAITEEYVTEYKKSLDGMNFIEISGAVKYLQDQLNAIKQSKAMIDALGGSKESFSELASKINAESALASNDIEASIEDFYANYEDSFIKLEDLLDYAQEKAKVFDDVKKSSTFITQAMVDYIEKHVNHNTLNYKISLQAVTNRTNVDWLCEHIINAYIPTKRMMQYVAKIGDDAVKNVQKHVAESLGKSPATKQPEALAAINAYLKEKAGFSDSDAFYFLYALSCTYAVACSKKNGIHKWIDLFLMNILDVIGGRYDLEGGEELVIENLNKVKSCILTK